MAEIGINTDSFNPQILYVIETHNKGHLETSYHCHDFLELSYIISGKGTYKISDKYFKVKAGDLMPLNPQIYHREFASEGEELHQIHMGVKNFKLDSLPKNYLMNENFFGIVNFSKEGESFKNCCLEIIKEQKKNEPGFDLILKSLVMKLIVIILRETRTFQNNEKYNCCNFESSEKTNIVETIIAFMNKNYMHDISLDKISRNMYLSPVYISKIFKEETGDSPINYLIKIRLDRASYMLKNERDLSVKEISKKVGYNDAYYFSKLFKKYYGNSPLKFKQSMY